MSQRLHPADIEAIALRTAELVCADVAPRSTGTPEMIDVAEVARRYSVATGWVYEHADELGAVRLGTGPKARLRFDAIALAERLTVCSDSRRSEPLKPAPKANPGRRSTPAGAQEAKLLPIRPPGDSG